MSNLFNLRQLYSEMEQSLTEATSADLFAAAIAHTPNCPTHARGRGVVIPASGPKYFPCAWVCINILRELGCNLPIELWYLGPSEMSEQMQSLVQPLGVRCVDALAMSKLHPMRRLGGWELKPYAVLHSTFREVMLLDADNVPAVDPTYLFTSAEVQEHGAAFWPDPDWFGADHAIWRLTGVEYRREMQFESGQMLIDKVRCWRALHGTLWMNAHSDFWYRFIYGDKDTFHMSWRKADSPYAIPSRPFRGLEGAIIQFDFEKKPVFQHRICKWFMRSENRRIAGFQHEERCIELLGQLNAAWSPTDHPASTT